jgi:uncharacterized paraquat-inducible protein A
VSRLIAQILLSLLIFPLAGVLYTIAFTGCMESRVFGYRYREEPGFVFAGCLTWAFITVYWLALWRKSVRWTGERVTRTLGCFLAAAVVAVMIGSATSNIGRGIGYFVATVTAPLLWQLGTVLIWRETPAERTARLSGAGANAIVCPTCGYNLTGLKSTRCPECGSEFTLDQLIAAQPQRAQDELAV